MMVRTVESPRKQSSNPPAPHRDDRSPQQMAAKQHVRIGETDRARRAIKVIIIRFSGRLFEVRAVVITALCYRWNPFRLQMSTEVVGVRPLWQSFRILRFLMETILMIVRPRPESVVLLRFRLIVGHESKTQRRNVVFLQHATLDSTWPSSRVCSPTSRSRSSTSKARSSPASGCRFKTRRT